MTVEPGNSLEVPIRFQPESFGTKTATITVTSDDPANPRTIDVSGDAPPGKLAVTGSTYFGGVKCGRRAFRTIAVCNVGDCDLHVSEVAFKHKSRHWALVHNPFPATLHPGSCLNVTIRYKATQSEPRPSELVIRSDDPGMPVREVEIIAWTRCCCLGCCRSRGRQPALTPCQAHPPRRLGAGGADAPRSVRMNDLRQQWGTVSAMCGRVRAFLALAQSGTGHPASLGERVDAGAQGHL